MRPKMTTTTTVRPSASSGTSSVGCTREKMRENGSPPSRANAMDMLAFVFRHFSSNLLPYVILDEVVMIDVVANSKQIKGNINRQTVPALLLVALNLAPAYQQMVIASSMSSKNDLHNLVQRASWTGNHLIDVSSNEEQA